MEHIDHILVVDDDIDAKGQLRYTSFGEGNYDKQEAVIQHLLKEARS